MNKRAGGFTLVEIMIVVAIIALLAVIAIPNFLRARKRSQASTILEELRLIDAAKDQYAIEYSLKGSDTINWTQVQLYLKPTSKLYTSGGKDMFGNTYEPGAVDGTTYMSSVSRTEFSNLQLPSDFWDRFGAK